MSKAKLGRPSSYSDVIAGEILRRIAEGEALATICKSDCMPGYSTVMDWRRTQATFSDDYARARADAADALADGILSLADQVLAGEVNPHAGRVALDAKKWVASKLKPRVYGDRHVVDHDGGVTVEQTLQLEAPQWLVDLIPVSAMDEATLIDVTPDGGTAED